MRSAVAELLVDPLLPGPLSELFDDAENLQLLRIFLG
jgi:hypothetical protein